MKVIFKEILVFITKPELGEAASKWLSLNKLIDADKCRDCGMFGIVCSTN